MPAGRPTAYEWNTDESLLKRVEEWGGLHATYEEMALMLGVDKRTIINVMNQEGEFFHRYKKAYANSNCSLRRKQYEMAYEGNASMLIWLGKQNLGQTDKQEVDNTHRIERPEGADDAMADLVRRNIDNV